jgi:bla regulator protein blaR1
MRISKLVLVVAGIAAASAPLLSQTPAAKESFEVASIKPSTPGTRSEIKVEAGGRFIANGVPLGLLIAIAYHLQAYQMAGAQGWLMKDQWNIEATTAEGPFDPPPANPPYMGVSENMALRLRALLADRFALKTHWETRERQVYELALSAEGSKLKAVESPAQPGPPQASENGARPPLTPEGKLPANFVPPPGATVAGRGIIAASAISMDQIVVLLDRLMDYPVIDNTGLTGYFNVRLQFDPESTPRAMGAPAPPSAEPGAAPLPSNDPSIFAAIQQQLGLKLQSAKAPVDILVIDSASKPTEN